MVQAEVDPLTGAGRDAVLIDPDDARGLGLAAGDRVQLRSAVGEMEATVTLVRLPARTVQVHWPEGNVLIPAGPDHREPGSQVPDYNAVVTLTRKGP
jgi:anaerobic selenocysteine-containing dehydrogenase